MKIKKNLFWVMIPLYIGIFVMVLYLNGVLSGHIESRTNLMISLAFLAIVGVLLLASFISMVRMVKAVSALDKFSRDARKRYKKYNEKMWKEYARMENIFDIPALDRQFAKYQRMVLGNGALEKGRLSSGMDISEFINDSLLESIGQKHFNSALSGIFTGLGILGTFIGLSLGLMSFNGNDIFTISDNVGPLLDGMKVAFHTSVYGMLLSIAFSITYRALMAYTYDMVSEFVDTFRECVAPFGSEGNDMMSSLYSVGCSILNELSHISRVLDEKASVENAAMNKMANEFADCLSDSVADSLIKVGSAIRNQNKA